MRKPATGFALRTAVIGLLVGTILASAAYGQWRRSRYPPRWPEPGVHPDGRFTFTRVYYDRVRREEGGHGWNTDYPDSDRNFMNRFDEFTGAPVARDESGRPNHVVVTLTDPELFNYPFIFMSDVGTAGFSDLEVKNLRHYLLKGGFLYVDDFWGDEAWYHWTHQIGRALPPSEYPIVDIPATHTIFRILYSVPEVPQIPSIQFWRRTGGHFTSERGRESAQTHFRGIFDENDRLMVAMTHNTDIADGWEREMEDYEFFDSYSARSYAFGINVVAYAITH